MEPILLYGFPAGSSMGLVAALEWLGKPYRLCRVDMLGEMRQAPYKRINRRVETPVLITDRGEILTETMAIAAWLETRDTERRISFDLYSREAELMHQFMAFINTGFTGAFTALWVALEMEPPNPALQSALRQYGTDAVIRRHDLLEEMIGVTPFAIGDRPSLADGILVGVARWLEIHDVADPGRWPKLAALRRRLEADPAVVYASGLERGEPAKGNGSCRGHVDLATLVERFGN
ncbi:glutathione S-transferase family protein [Agrobacterium pusense]|uniref:glutathione S-transferase family protein n=1 Tax=Agrobacterium pusense TaxID=648995 RepID=UPI0028A985FD|nr:glutathione S-transferase family protein [Agrobacterium pusense]